WRICVITTSLSPSRRGRLTVTSSSSRISSGRSLSRSVSSRNSGKSGVIVRARVRFVAAGVSAERRVDSDCRMHGSGSRSPPVQAPQSRTFDAVRQVFGVALAPRHRDTSTANRLENLSVNDLWNPNCVFCRVIGGDEMVSLIYEDEEVIAFLDIQPLYPGHVLVVPKAHYENLFDITEALAARTVATARRILPGLARATGCRAVNLFSANGADG